MIPESEFNRQLLAAKLEAMAEFAAGAGHEINNPLATIIGRAAQLLKEESDPERRRQLETIGAQAYRIRDMIGDAMLFARPPAPQCKVLRLAPLLDAVIARFQDELEEKGIALSLAAEADVTAFADELQISIVISELLRNAIQAAGNFGHIAMELARREQDEATWARLRVADDGGEFSEEEREHCFDPFFSGRQAGRGLGFGLPKCWRILQQHHGSIELLSSGEMTVFEVLLPSLTTTG
ncbi:ATP-binding protein [Planctomicrobium sp. SH664]|uniref:ATP-binding protein n=1 Tax=Planctomicrobium sp. SH664 TaxID=3448125 RepID=UPI003F5C3358